MMSRKIGEGGSPRDHNIDKKINCYRPALRRDVRVVPAPARSLPRGSGVAMLLGPPRAAKWRFFGIVAILDGKRIPLFLNMH
jgi:hypothetical protein